MQPLQLGVHCHAAQPDDTCPQSVAAPVARSLRQHDAGADGGLHDGDSGNNATAS